MRKLLVLAVLIAGFVWLVEGLTTISVKNAYCAYCPDIPCYSQGGCYGDCLCLIPSGETQGSCVSIGE